MNKLLAITGFSGAGKDAVAAELIRRGYVSVIPHTTRPMRIGEVEGNPYYFIDDVEFMRMVDADEFIEYNSYMTKVEGVEDRWYYGTAKNAVLTDTKNILTVGVQSAVRTKQALDNKVTTVFVDVTDSVRQERAISRGSFDQQEWDNRLSQDSTLRALVDINTLMDFNVDNIGPLSETVDEIERLLHA